MPWIFPWETCEIRLGLFILNPKHKDSENAFITRLSLLYMTYFHNYPITGLYILYKQLWQKDLKLQLQCECPINWIWSQDAFATKISGAKILCLWLYPISFLDSGSMGRVQKYCFQSLPRAGLVGPRSWVGNLPSKQAAVQDVGLRSCLVATTALALKASGCGCCL